MTPWYNWTYIRRSEDVPDVFWKSIYVYFTSFVQVRMEGYIVAPKISQITVHAFHESNIINIPEMYLTGKMGSWRKATGKLN